MIELSLDAARVAFSTRAGGVSEGPYESLNLGILTDDDPGRVRENRSRLVNALGIPRERVAMGWQVHGTGLQDWDAAPDPQAELERVDGHLTRERGLALLVLVADCLPVALAGGDRVAMVHCGWRGLAGGILADAVSRFDTTPAAAIGPGIGACCYEVGEEVHAQFEDVEGAARGRMLDLRRVARARLEAAGVAEIRDVDLCTSCREDLFFSHRRDNGVTGRQGGLVWRV